MNKIILRGHCRVPNVLLETEDAPPLQQVLSAAPELAMGGGMVPNQGDVSGISMH